MRFLPPAPLLPLPPLQEEVECCRWWCDMPASQLTADDTEPKLLTESASSKSGSGDLEGVSGCDAWFFLSEIELLLLLE